MFPFPVEFEYNADDPTAVFSMAAIFEKRALEPIAVLYEAVVFEFRAEFPIAVLLVPVVLENKEYYTVVEIGSGEKLWNAGYAVGSRVYKNTIDLTTI